MDSTAITFCMDNELPIIVFDVSEPGNIMRALVGEPIGTLVQLEGGRVTHPKVDEAKDKMHKAVVHLQEEFGGGAYRSRDAGARRQVARRLLRLRGAVAAAGRLLRARAARARDRAVRQGRGQGHREGDPSQSDLGVNPSNDGAVIRLTFPELTADRRKQLVKVVKTRAEEGRVAVRNVRRHIRQELEHLEKDGDLSRDELDRIEKDLEKLTHDVIAEIDTMLGHKEKELLEV